MSSRALKPRSGPMRILGVDTMGALITLLVCALLVYFGYDVCRRWIPQLDNAESVAVGGTLALMVSGLLILGFGLFSISLGFVAVPLIAAVAFWKGRRKRPDRSFKFNPFLIPLALLLVIPLISVLAPSDTRDWDSLAYHLAVPKLWIQQGHVGFVQGIHHSNFPFTADMLYVWGLQWGGQAGAKAFNLAWLILGCFAVFGITRRWYPENKQAPWWAALALAGCPVILWEAGTGYIDIPHGLFCGLATLYLADALKSGDKKFWWLTGISLGFAMGTKHTGLQTLGAILVVGVLFSLTLKKGQAREDARPPVFKSLALAAGLALLIASPWYIKSIAYTGNPVYPFFYKQLGGKFWNQWRSDIYTVEQKSFGVGSSPTQLGHAVLGLAYQPGRYVNPAQDKGRGFPSGSIGFAALLGGLLVAASGKAREKEKIVLGVIGIALLAWFVLSQQSRYLTSLVVPLAVIGAGAIDRFKLGRAIPVAIAAQALYSAGMLWVSQTQTQLLVVSGQVSADEYQKATVAFYQPAQAINALPGNVKVALFDEVFGYFLDKPYMWGNPGHSTLLYEGVNDWEGFEDRLKELGFTDIYVNLQFMDGQTRLKFVQACAPSPDEALAQEWHKQLSDPQLAWRVYVTELARAHHTYTWLPDQTNPRSVLITIGR